MEIAIRNQGLVSSLKKLVCIATIIATIPNFNTSIALLP